MAPEEERQSRRPSQGLLRRVAGLFGAYKSRLALIGGAILVTSVLGDREPAADQGGLRPGPVPVDGGPDLQLLFVLVGVMIADPGRLERRSASARPT